MAAASASAGDAVGVACSDDALARALDIVGDAGFTSAQQAMLRALCQNFVFTTEQAAALLEKIGMSDDKLASLDIFESRLTDPENADPIVALFSFSSDQEAAAAKLSGFSAAKAGEMAEFAIEDDGVRSDDDMARFLGALDAASMSSDKVEVARLECEEHPTPPLNCDQLIEVLGKFSFSDDARAVLELFAGPAIVYPMKCADIVRVLEVFGMSDDRIAVLPSLKPFIADAEEKLTIVASFSFSSDKEKAEEILRDVVVKLVPPEPPMAKVQEVLRRIGSCPSGYAWRKVPAGWRCAAGGHYVSDDAVAANL